MGYEGFEYALGETLVRIVVLSSTIEFPQRYIFVHFSELPSDFGQIRPPGDQVYGTVTCLFFATTGHQGCISDVSTR
jgi:hypothetical protein